MFFNSLKNWINTLLAVAVSALVALFVWAMGATRFSAVEGERRFYLDSPSSQAKREESLSLFDIARVRGESLSLSAKEGEEMIAALSAKVLFIEEIGETRAYYCYTPKYHGGVLIGEYLVNLQVAVTMERCVVGSPIIFGGF